MSFFPKHPLPVDPSVQKPASKQSWYTEVMEAIREGTPESIERIHALYAVADSQWIMDQLEDSPVIRYACRQGQVLVVEALLSHPKIKAAGGWSKQSLQSGFRWACADGQIEVVRYLTNNRALKQSGYKPINIHEDEEMPWAWACSNGHMEVMRYLAVDKALLEAGHTWVDIHAHEDEGFRSALLNEQMEVIEWLMTSRELSEAGHLLVNPLRFEEKILKECVESAQKLSVVAGLKRMIELQPDILHHGSLKETLESIEDLQPLLEALRQYPRMKEALSETLTDPLKQEDSQDRKENREATENEDLCPFKPIHRL